MACPAPPHWDLPVSQWLAVLPSQILRSAAQPKRASGPFPPFWNTPLTLPHPSPQGLPGLAGPRSLKACELTLGTELWGPQSRKADSQTGLAIPHSTEAGPARQDARTQEEMPDGLSLSVGFRKIPAWKIPCLSHTTVWALLDNSDSNEKTNKQTNPPKTSSRGAFLSERECSFSLVGSPRPEKWAWIRLLAKVLPSKETAGREQPLCSYLCPC